jgi:hypothetical protein
MPGPEHGRMGLKHDVLCGHVRTTALNKQHIASGDLYESTVAAVKLGEACA